MIQSIKLIKSRRGFIDHIELSTVYPAPSTSTQITHHPQSPIQETENNIIKPILKPLLSNSMTTLSASSPLSTKPKRQTPLSTSPLSTKLMRRVSSSIISTGYNGDAEGTTAFSSAATSQPRAATEKTMKIHTLGKHPVQPTENDILYGRGHFTNKHPGNIHYRNVVIELKPTYQLLTMKEKKKMDVPMQVIKTMKDEDRRFLMKKDEDGLWYEVSDKKAREKARQALTEQKKTNLDDTHLDDFISPDVEEYLSGELILSTWES